MELLYFNQDITAYTAKPGAVTASGMVPEVGYVAVHPAVWGMNQWNNPVIPFFRQNKKAISKIFFYYFILKSRFLQLNLMEQSCC